MRQRLPSSIRIVSLAAALCCVCVAVSALDAQERTTLRIQQPPALRLPDAERPQPKAPPAPKQASPAPQASPEPAPPARPPAEMPAPRDPTVVRPDLRPVLDPPATQQATVVPTVALRGRIVLSSGQSAGILDVSGQLFMIQEGSVIDTFIGQGTPVTVKVKKFSASGVAVEIEQLGKTFQLR